jgi:hypothetical protein
MKQMRYFFAVLVLCAFQQSEAQTDSTGPSPVQFKLSLNYNSSLNYYGRTDSLKSTGLFPLAELWFSKDIYVNAAPVFVNNSSSSFEYAGTVTTLGYLHVTDKWITSAYVMKPFYKKSSQLVQSALQAQAGMGLSYENKIVNTSLGADVKFSDRMDFGATAGLDHVFRSQWKDKSVLVIDPSFYAYAGTQNFTNTYYKKDPGLLLFPGNTETIQKNVRQFNMLAYEFSLPLIYVRGGWMALLTPAYILPRSLVSVPNRPDLSERGQDMFYATIGLKRSF